MDFFRTIFVVLAVLVADFSFAKTSNSSIELESGNTVALNAYYSELNPTRRSLGVTLTSDLPVSSGSASIDYVMSQPGQDQQERLDDAQLVQVRVNSSLSSFGHKVDYGLRYFSAGEQFQPTELRAELQHYLLPAGAEGKEAWANLRLAGIDIKPQVRQVESDQVQTETWLVNAQRALNQSTLVSYHFQDSTDDREGLIVETTRSHVDIRNRKWTLSWQQSEQRTQQASNTLYEDQLQAVAGSLSVIEETRAKPNISLSLQMQAHQRMLRKDTSLLAGVNVAKKVYWLGEHAQPAQVQAAFTYQRRELDNGLQENDEFGFQISFQQAI